jgi:hypothetical protein
MPIKLINADFYRVKVEDKDKRGFCDLLDVIQALPKGIGRAQQRTEDAIRLQSVSKGQTAWSAEMLRIRLNESHVRAKLSGETAELQLDDDEGLGEETAFVFHHGPSILVVQKNRAGVTASAFAKYLKVLCKAKSISFEPVLKKALWSGSRECKPFTSLRFILRVFKTGDRCGAEGTQLGRCFQF